MVKKKKKDFIREKKAQANERCWMWIYLKKHATRTELKRPHILWFHVYEMLRKGRSTETENRLLVTQDWGWELDWPVYKWAQGLFMGNRNALQLECGSNYTIL